MTTKEGKNVTAFRYFQHSTTGWENLFKLGSLPVIRSMYIWIVLVPLVAKLLENIRGEATLVIFQHSFVVNFDLPFSWQLFNNCPKKGKSKLTTKEC